MKLQFNSRELLIMIAAAVMSLLVNLPDDMLGKLVDRKALLAGLIALVVVALFKYLQIYLLLTITILAIGANLPSDLAVSMGVSKTAMIISLGILIVIGLLNRVMKLLPEKHHHEEMAEEDYGDPRQKLMNAIMHGDQVTLTRLLVMNLNPNFEIDGTSPLHFAAERGYPEMVRMLINYGADFRKKDAAGRTALEIALDKKKFVQTTELLHNAGKSYSQSLGFEETQRMDAEIWNKQHRS